MVRASIIVLFFGWIVAVALVATTAVPLVAVLIITAFALGRLSVPRLEAQPRSSR
jgi:hypothetical protein